ncbi:Os03g0618566 [Oryza sativa Japonica Group]|uniref:Os03g0618566 protein n=1 Tax=Oryza sativa subsp. japonica TaxID=39947 RepID=A0A0P0W083_ORYSJ|nr:Os03g0618566 [Oryza sativa Japonica Group]
MPREVPESPQWFREAPESPPRPDDDHPTGPPIGRRALPHMCRPLPPARAGLARQHELQQPAAGHAPRRAMALPPTSTGSSLGGPNPATVVADLPPPLPATGVHCLPRA